MNDIHPHVYQTKTWRQRLDETLQIMKRDSDTRRERVSANDSPRASRERSLAITKLQEAIMWLGMDLKAIREENGGGDDPYPGSYDPSDARIAPPADVKL